MRTKTVLILFAIVFSTTAMWGSGVKLPGEEQAKPPLDYTPFPSRMHQFVWRNWTVVPETKLAEVLQTTPDKVAALATSMGLLPQQTIQPEWQTKGYITVLRRNWHILPYSQILQLLGVSAERLYESLMEDDFLFIKLGRIKPKCEELIYREPDAAQQRAAAQLAAWLKEEGTEAVLQVGSEPRFEFVKVLSQPDTKIKIEAAKQKSAFELRYIFSYFADFEDPLSDPEIASYPEGLFQRLAAVGVNGVWLHTVLRTLAKDPAFPEFGEGSEQRIAALRTLVARGKKYGVDVFLYINEPRTMPLAFFDAKPERAAMRGVAGLEGQARLCTSHPEVQRWLRDALSTIFREVPGLGGVFTITASENHTNCASHGKWKNCPNCKERSDAEILAEVNTIVAEGVHRVAPDARVIAWDWGWRMQGDATDIIKLLPKKCWLMSVSERSLPIERGGIASEINEYSISGVGPGPRALRNWKAAQEAGLKTIAKVQVGVTWEFSAIPYIPTMDLIAEHAKNLNEQGTDGVMLSWSLGCYPSPNLEVFQAFNQESSDIDSVLNKVAEHRYGKGAVAGVRAAWSAFSDGFREYPFHIGTLYRGPQHMGPANPLYLKPTGYQSTMVGLPYDHMDGWRSIYPPEVWSAQMEKVRDGFAQGCKLWESMLPLVNQAGREEATRELGLFRSAELHFDSCVNQIRFVVVRDKMLAAKGDKTKAECCKELRQIVAKELETTKQLLPLNLADSRTGYESSNHYFYIPQDLLEKIICCRHILHKLEKE